MGEGLSISVRGSEPCDVTEVSVIHAAGNEKTSEPGGVTDSSAVDLTETDVKVDQHKRESTEKSAEQVTLLFVLSI